MQMRDDLGETSSVVQNMDKEVSIIHRSLQGQRHDPELGIVYVLFTVMFVSLAGLYFTLRAVRDSIVKFLWKEAITNARLELVPKPLDKSAPFADLATNYQTSKFKRSKRNFDSSIGFAQEV